jgi:xanthine permease XanP
MILLLLGLFPVVGGLLQQIPAPVLGGATLVMFGSVVAAGIRIMTQNPLGRREMLIIAISFGIGLGIEAVPEVLGQFPKIIGNIFGHAVTSGGIAAMVLNLLMPHDEPQIVKAGAATSAR